MFGKDNQDFLPYNININMNMNKSSKNDKKLLNHKRRRRKEDNEFIIDNNSKNKLIKEENSKEIKSFKFQDFPKNYLIVIFSYLDFGDLLKLKNIGCRNVRNLINEIIETKKGKGYFNLRLISSIKTNAFICDKDSIQCQQYFYLNLLNNYEVQNKLRIIYIIYNKSSNKNYYLIKTCFSYYFCACDVIKKISASNWKEDILFKIKELRHFDKFQFIDESKVVFFSLNTLLLYDLNDNDYKYHLFLLDYNCDFVLFKKNINILIVPHVSFNYISFYSINKSLPKKVMKEKYKKEIIHCNKTCENGQVIVFVDNLVCYFCSCSYYVKIFDVKKKEIVDNIRLESAIENIDLNKRYLIIYTVDNSLNFFDKNNLQHKFTFNLDKNGIKYISMIKPFYDNIFLVVKKNNKMCLMYLENNYFSFVPLDNQLNVDVIENKKFIVNSLFKGKIVDDDDEILFKLNTKMIYMKDFNSINECFINDFVIDI